MVQGSTPKKSLQSRGENKLNIYFCVPLWAALLLFTNIWVNYSRPILTTVRGGAVETVQGLPNPLQIDMKKSEGKGDWYEYGRKEHGNVCNVVYGTLWM
jgi:hypothetical protein